MKRLTFRDEWPAPNNYMLELGRMTATWGTLESSVNVAISKLAGYTSALDYRAYIMVAHSNFQQRVNIVSTLCEQLATGYPRLKTYKAVISKIESAQKARNLFAHNAITTDQDTGAVTVSFASARGTLKTGTQVVHINDIKEATAKTHEAMCALHTLVTGHELKPIWERVE